MTNPIDILISEFDKVGSIWQNKQTLKRGDYLVNQGETDTSIYWVKKGSLRIFILDEDEEYTIRFGYENSILGAMDSYLTNEPTDFFIQAIKETEVWSISKMNFEQMLEEHVELKNLHVKSLEALVYQQLEREKDLLIQSPQKRYERVLKRSPQLFQEIPSKYIASYLRMTPETLSRIKKS